MGKDTPALPVGRNLDLDPDLGFGIGGADLEEARRACRGPVMRVHPGIWEDAERVARLGAVIVEGRVSREVALGEHHMFELLGPETLWRCRRRSGASRWAT